MTTLIEIIQTLGVTPETINNAIKKAVTKKWETVTVAFDHCYSGYGKKRTYEGTPSKNELLYICIKGGEIAGFSLRKDSNPDGVIGVLETLQKLGKPSLFWEEYSVEGLGYLYQDPHGYKVMFSIERKTFTDDLSVDLIKPLLLEVVNDWENVSTQIVEYAEHCIIKLKFGEYTLTYTTSEGAITTHGDLYEMSWTTSQAGFTLRRKDEDVVLNASINCEDLHGDEATTRLRKLRNGEYTIKEFITEITQAGFSYEENTWYSIY